MQSNVERVISRSHLENASECVQRQLKALFAISGKSYADLGSPHGLTAAQVSSLLNGQNPTLRTLMVMAKVGGVRLEDLMKDVT